MRKNDPRGNAGREIEYPDLRFTTRLPFPPPDQSLRFHGTPRDYQCEAGAGSSGAGSSGARSSGVRLRFYQRAAVEAVLAAHDRGESSGLCALPTGAGKTIVAAELLRRLSGRALVVAHTQVLVSQIRAALAAYLREAIGILVAGTIKNGDARVVVATRQSFTASTAARLANLAQAGTFETLIVDEAHHAVNNSSYAILIDALRAHASDHRAPELFVLGLTATPWSESGRLLFERWWFSREIADLIPLGVLAPVRYERVELPLHLRSVRVRRSSASGKAEGDYSIKALESPLLAVANETAARIAPLVCDLRHVVVFAVSVKHAHALAIAFTRAGVSATPIWGTMRSVDRDDAIAAWRAGDVRALINVGVVAEGFDEPRISAIVFARPTASTLFYLQALGRGLRVAPGKRECLVIDGVGLANLRDARQCTLDAIVPEISALGADHRRSGTPHAEYHGRRVVSKPSDDSDRLWLKIAHDAFVLNVETSASFFIIRDETTGLYRTVLVENAMHVEELITAPFPVVLSVVRDRLRGMRVALYKSGARWRREPATSKQLLVLTKLQPELARQALTHTWNRGRVSNEIAIFFALVTARRLGLLADANSPSGEVA